jgi:hypothetical protein
MVLEPFGHFEAGYLGELDVHQDEVGPVPAGELDRLDDELKSIPVIAITAFAMKGDEERIREGGCEAYLTSGSWMSIRMRSGRCRRASSIASIPLAVLRVA